MTIDDITRIDRYTVEVDGYRVRATEDQEQRLRGMTSEQRANFLLAMGRRP